MKTPQERLAKEVTSRASILMHHRRMEFSRAVHQSRLDILRADAEEIGEEKFRRAAIKMFESQGNLAAAHEVCQMNVGSWIE